MDFLHLGDIGDVIYSVPTVRCFNGALHLGTGYQMWASKYKHYLPDCPVELNKKDMYDKVMPQGLQDDTVTQLSVLLNACEGLEDRVHACKLEDIDERHVNLMEWRILRGRYKDAKLDHEFLDYRFLNLAQCHALSVTKAGFLGRNLEDSIVEFEKQYWTALEGKEGLWNAAWLTLKDQPPEVDGKVLIARSCRHDASKETWLKLIARYPQARFVGDQKQYEFGHFRDEFDFKGDQVPTEDLLALAKEIATCSLFIGNQSAPLALAIALGKRVIIAASTKVPNCIFRRPTITVKF